MARRERRVQQKWRVLEDDVFCHVLPDPDIKPHGFPGEDNKYTVAGSDCPCNPEVQFCDTDGVLFTKPLIGHKSFYDEERIAESMKRICA